MLLFALGTFELAEVQEDGATLEAHLKSLWRQSRKMPAQLDIPPIPRELEHIWDWWLALAMTRPTGMEAGHITYAEVESWSRLLKIGVTKFEVTCLMALDTVFVNCQTEARAKKAASGGN